MAAVKSCHNVPYVLTLLQCYSAKELLESFSVDYCTQAENALLVSEMQKNWGLYTGFVSEIKPLENYPDFKELAHVTQHGLQGFIINKYSPKWR